jgi:N-acetylglucosaminyl-diphospho-decaprenol L-rhamnosyltransferase
MNDTVGVVAVTFSSGESLDAFLLSLDKASARPLDIVIADNGSTDDAPERASRRPDVRLLRTGGNLGYGKAANLGVQATSSDWVVIANPDVIWTPGSLDDLLAAADRWPRAAAVGPLIRTPAGDIYPSARRLPSLSGGAGHALLGWCWPANPWTAAYREERGVPHEREAGWLSGSCLLVRRAAFQSIGGFDPRYFMYFEDVDLGDRLGAAGWLNIYAPAAEVIHEGSHSTSKHAGAMLAEHHRSAYRYLSGRYPGWRWFPVRLALRTGLAARARVAPKLAEIAERRRAAARRPHLNRPFDPARRYSDPTSDRERHE